MQWPRTSRSGWAATLYGITAGLVLACLHVVPVYAAEGAAALLAEGKALREQGDIALSIQALTQAHEQAANASDKAAVAAELGASLFQAGRYADADAAFSEAYAASEGSDKARQALSRGNVASVQKKPDQARAFYADAQSLAPNDPAIQAAAGLNLARLLPVDTKLDALKALPAVINRIPDNQTRAAQQINLGQQARGLGQPGQALAWQQLDAARQTLQGAGPSRLLVEALDALAQLYEDDGRVAEAGSLNAQALSVANGVPSGAATDLLINLRWREGRLQAAQGNVPAAIASYQQAVDLIESIRMDIPIEYEDGRSSYRSLLEPVYAGLMDLMLKNVSSVAPAEQQSLLQRVSNTSELLKQTEMQDFLGDRCAVEEIKGSGGGGGGAQGLPPQTAIFYPIVFDDRTELLVMQAGGMQRMSVPVGREALKKAVTAYDETLRYQDPGYLEQSQFLYNTLIRPVESVLAQAGIHNMVIVPDSSLRVVPFASLHDGKQYLIEKMAVASVAGMSMTTVGDEGRIDQTTVDNALVVGMSTPGPVVEKLAAMESSGAGDTASAQSFAAVRSARLKEDLALPGVDVEMQKMSGVLAGGTALKNEQFTLDNFRQQVTQGEYQILHIASHGVFGGTEDTSYIMTYDNIVRMNDLQKMLDTGRAKQHHIRLLTLSACQTAEGSETAPIGISGAAIKARARSVLGTLWPVDDDSAQQFMTTFYQGIAQKSLTKAEAVRQAQVAMIHTQDREHPFYWAPFTLIGNWQ